MFFLYFIVDINIWEIITPYVAPAGDYLTILLQYILRVMLTAQPALPEYGMGYFKICSDAIFKQDGICMDRIGMLKKNCSQASVIALAVDVCCTRNPGERPENSVGQSPERLKRVKLEYRIPIRPV